MAAMELGDDGAARQWRSCAALLRRVEEAKENKKWNVERVWQARGGSSRGQRCQDGRGAWPRGQAASDGCPPRDVHFLKTSTL